MAKKKDNSMLNIFTIVERLAEFPDEDLDYLIRELSKEHKRRLSQKQKEVAQQIRDLAKPAGLAVDIKVIDEEQPKLPKKAKYADPDNPRNTWSGIGAKPKWIKDKLDSGLTLEDLQLTSFPP